MTKTSFEVVTAKDGRYYVRRDTKPFYQPNFFYEYLVYDHWEFYGKQYFLTIWGAKWAARRAIDRERQEEIKEAYRRSIANKVVYRGTY